MTALFLSSEEVSGLADPEDFVDAIRAGYRERGEERPAKPRTTLRNDDPEGKLTSYGAVLPETGAMGGYMYSSGFTAQDAWFATPLFDATTGEPLAIVDGASMNPFKTGATGAVGVDALARENVDSLAIFGSSAQARGQLRATVTVRDFKTVDVYSPTKAHREEFAAEMDDHLNPAVTAVASPSAAVEGADVVITATRSSEPVFDGDDLDEGTHVTAMGQYHPEKRELDETTIKRATYVPDLRERVPQDAGSFIAAKDAGVVDESDIYAELGEVVAGGAEGRTGPDEITVFDSGGTGIETVAGAYLLYERALEHDDDLGTEVDWLPASKALTGK